MGHCCYSKDGTACTACARRSTYGSYCYKHRSEHLVSEGMIRRDRFTGLSKDYYIRDLRHYCYVHSSDTMGYLKQLSKGEVFERVSSLMETQRLYESGDFLKQVVVLQRMMRGCLVRAQGSCHNREDFYTFDELQTLPSSFYFSYRDAQGFRWGFDIRSFKKLIDLGYQNPYTTEDIPPKVVCKALSKVRALRLAGVPLEIENTKPRSREEAIKQSTVDIFSRIEQSGYPCEVSWFLDLRLSALKELYKQMEDMWHYRLQLPRHMKATISPPEGRIFVTPLSRIMEISSKEEIQELILNDISTFARAESDSNRKLGYMYFIICLGYVSPPCLQSHNWILHI